MDPSGRDLVGTIGAISSGLFQFAKFSFVTGVVFATASNLAYQLGFEQTALLLEQAALTAFYAAAASFVAAYFVIEAGALLIAGQQVYQQFALRQQYRAWTRRALEIGRVPNAATNRPQFREDFGAARIETATGSTLTPSTDPAYDYSK